MSDDNKRLKMWENDTSTQMKARRPDLSALSSQSHHIQCGCVFHATEGLFQPNYTSTLFDLAENPISRMTV
jgi:hypothetical protein